MQLPSCLSSLNEAVHSTIFTARACARHRAYIARAMPRKPLALAIETVDDDDADADDAAASSSTPGGAYSFAVIFPMEPLPKVYCPVPELEGEQRTNRKLD